ncbi:MAG: ATP synthase F1 subunit gamma [Desulfitobacteriia bacterium]
MAGVRDIRRRIRSVANLEQIAKAMKTIATAKLRKSRAKVIASRPYTKEIQEVVTRLAQASNVEDHPFLNKRPVKTVGYLLITSDRGLCGGYNANLIRRTNDILDEQKEAETALVVVGRKGRDYFLKRGKKILAYYTGLGDDPVYEQAGEIAEKVTELYLTGQLDEVHIIYSRFISALSQEPTVSKLLPLEPAPLGVQEQYISEPPQKKILEKLLPAYLENRIFSALLESKTSEMGAKMTAMDSATENAKEVIRKLTLAMNRARQEAITKEISEIVGGAAALE